MQENPVELLQEWIVRDAKRREEFRQYDLTETDHLFRKYLERPDLIGQAPQELIAAADRHLCGLIRKRAYTWAFAKKPMRSVRSTLREARVARLVTTH